MSVLEVLKYAHTGDACRVSAEDRTNGESITALLFELGRGNRDVEARLAPRVYSELRRTALRQMRRERANHTLQATILALDEIAFVLDVSTRTVKRDWNMARAWLHDELSKEL